MYFVAGCTYDEDKTTDVKEINERRQAVAHTQTKESD